MSPARAPFPSLQCPVSDPILLVLTDSLPPSARYTGHRQITQQDDCALKVSNIITQQIEAHRMASASAGLRSAVPLAPAEMRPSQSTNLVSGRDSMIILATRARHPHDQAALVRCSELMLILPSARYMPIRSRPRLRSPTNHLLLP